MKEGFSLPFKPLIPANSEATALLLRPLTSNTIPSLNAPEEHPSAHKLLLIVRKLTLTKEQTIVRYTSDLDLRGFAPQLCKLADMADKLLGVHSCEPVDKHWAEHFLMRSAELKLAFNRAKDRQRILQEDPEVIGMWSKLVDKTKAKYGIHNHDMLNFDKTGFQMGIIGTMNVVTDSERHTQPELIQPGDCKWVTAIRSVCTAGSCTPTFHYLQKTHPHLCLVQGGRYTAQLGALSL
jgi:hypothetical protein